MPNHTKTSPVGDVPQRSRPNVLLVFSDQQRWCDLGCYGNAEVRSPNLDPLAAGGTRFALAVSNAPLCVPARGSILTGLHGMRHGAFANDLPVRDDVESLADVFRRGGYHTGYIGKWHLAGIPREAPVPPEKRLRFETWRVTNCNHEYYRSHYDDDANVRHPISGYEPETQTALAQDFISSHAGEPWFLALSWGPPHSPYHPAPQPWDEYYAGRDLPLRENTAGGPGSALPASEVRDMLRGYYAHISALDALFGSLVGQLDRDGQLENTIVVYASDHGDMLGSQGLLNKQVPYDESIRVPLLMAGPGIARSKVCEAPIGLVDLAPTLAGCCGLRFETAVDGGDRSGSVREGGTEPEDASCYLYELTACHQATQQGTPPWRGIRTAAHTYAARADGTPWLLFDNRTDPMQLRNLVDSPAHAGLQARLAESLALSVQRHDGFCDAETLLRRAGLADAWQANVEYFGHP